MTDPIDAATAPRRPWLVPVIAATGTLAVVATGFFLRHHAEAGQNHVALAASPKDVTVVHAEATSYQPTHRYVGTLRPWVEASVGPQLVAAYVNTVLVRPGASVKSGQVLATLDCRDASARSHAIESQARALAASQMALAAQSARVKKLLPGGYVAENEVEQRTAESDAEEAKLHAEESTLVDSKLAVNDCVLRAPFDGEVGERRLDPGAFVHSGESVVTVIDRSVVRLVVDVPEEDFGAVAPGTPVTVHLLAMGQELRAEVSRRSPSADPSTRTVHVEIDLPDGDRRIPVNTTAEVWVGVGQAVPATRLPLIAADLSDEKARVFTVEQGLAHAETLAVLGESGGDLYLSPSVLPAGQAVVLEGRLSLDALPQGDPVNAHERPAVSDAGLGPKGVAHD